MQSIGVAERLGLGPEVRELKLGSSITSNTSKFHTLKYDFKPASVDDSKVAKVDVGADNTVTVTVPHLDGAGTPHTVFKGSQRPYNKEYVLIIDKATGEITLERLSANIQVKKTRTEQKRNGNSSMPMEIKKSPPDGRANGKTKVISGKKKEPLVQLNSKQQSPQRTSPYHKKSPPSTSINNCSPQPLAGQSTLASLPMIGDNDDFVLSTPITATSSMQAAISPVLIPNAKSTSLESDSSDSNSSSNTSDSSSSDSETENATANGQLNGITASTHTTMPDNILNDDLQLSESESD